MILSLPGEGPGGSPGPPCPGPMISAGPGRTCRGRASIISAGQGGPIRSPGDKKQGLYIWSREAFRYFFFNKKIGAPLGL